MKQWNRYSILSSAEYTVGSPLLPHTKADKYLQLFVHSYLNKEKFKRRLCLEDRNDTSEQRGLKDTERKPSESEFVDVIWTKSI
jgi:hypothetical protein